MINIEEGFSKRTYVREIDLPYVESDSIYLPAIPIHRDVIAFMEKNKDKKVIDAFLYINKEMIAVGPSKVDIKNGIIRFVQSQVKPLKFIPVPREKAVRIAICVGEGLMFAWEIRGTAYSDIEYHYDEALFEEWNGYDNAIYIQRVDSTFIGFVWTSGK